MEEEIKHSLTGGYEMKKFLLAILLAQMIFVPAMAADFLSSARGGGMGFSYFLYGDDPSGAVYNPADIGYARGWQSYMMLDIQNDHDYLTQQADPYDGRFAAVYPITEIGAVAINTQQTGSFEKTPGVTTVDHFAATYAREFAPGWSAGTSLKYMFETAYGQRSAFDFDLGITYRSSIGLIGAVAFENIARAKLSPDYLGFEEYLPRRERFGLGYVMADNSWRGSFGLAGQIEESGISEKHTTTLMNLGSEWWLMADRQVSVGLRGGYTFGKGIRWDQVSDYSGVSGGISLNFKVGINDLRLDYAIRTYPFDAMSGRNPVDHIMAVSFGWGGVPDYSFKSSSDEEPVQTAAPTIYEEFVPPVPKVEVIDKDTDFTERHFAQYDVMMEVADVSAMDFKRIVFYVKPQQVVVTNNWKLYVFRAKVKKWTDSEIDRWALRVIEGKGVPPLNIVWDGVSDDGKLLPPGRYYYVLTAEDADGNAYATKWYDFKLK